MCLYVILQFLNYIAGYYKLRNMEKKYINIFLKFVFNLYTMNHINFTFSNYEHEINLSTFYGLCALTNEILE